jgi:hypothetical protein
MTSEGTPCAFALGDIMADTAGQRRQALEDVEALRDQGWYWSDTTPGLLLSPEDPDVHLWHDGVTGELVYSPKVVEMMGRLLLEEEGS